MSGVARSLDFVHSPNATQSQQRELQASRSTLHASTSASSTQGIPLCSEGSRRSIASRWIEAIFMSKLPLF
ncbi:hypothetical protein J6590_007752 [Homalodisca vitripennis]|nr:hypothetical protein J6590_007752 [Homalodisca vitripennis]